MEFTRQHVQRLRDIYQEIVSSEDFRQYSEYREIVNSLMEDSEVPILEALESNIGAMADAETELAQAERRVPSLWVLILPPLIGVFGVYSVASIGVNIFFERGWVATYYPGLTILFAIIMTVLTLVGLLVLRALRNRQRMDLFHARIHVDEMSNQFKQKRLILVREALSSIVNSVLGPEGKLEFPTVAPRLVELNTSEVVHSSSAQYLREFINGHDSSAIGIAGPRGSGKSTLMRGLKADSKLDSHVVALTAPVRYESLDFMRRMAHSAADYIDELAGSPAQKAVARQRRRVQASRLLIATVALGAGFGLLLADIAPATATGLPVIGVAGAVGVTISAFAIYLAVMVLLGRERRVRPIFRVVLGSVVQHYSSNQTSTFLAASMLRRLAYSSESSAKSKNISKLFGGLFSTEDEDSLTLKDRELTHADLSAELRRLLFAFARDQYPSKVIIAVDELDKISDRDDLIRTVNDIKDLFHIDGVHFVVSVSTDALHSFEQRGLPTRDAFDSSFDTIIRILPLTLDESLALLSARSQGFPPIVGAFCHAWSGGLPRDLLRVARRCVEMHRNSHSAPSVDVLVRDIIVEDVVAIIEGRLRSEEATAADRAALSELRKRARALGMVGKSLPTGLTVRGDSSYGGADPALGSIASVVALGEGIVAYFKYQLATPARVWTVPDAEIFVAAAKAVSYRGEPDELRAEVFENALTEIVSRVLVSEGQRENEDARADPDQDAPRSPR